MRAYHRFLSGSVVENLRVDSNAVFSYRKGVSIVDAVGKHSGSKFFFKTDFKDFFNSIDAELVKETIRENFENLPFRRPEKYLAHIVRLLTAGRRLPAGFITSPGLSNACLYNFDQLFGGECRDLGLIYTRYSDDIIVSGVSYSEVRNIDRLLVRTLYQLYSDKFSVNFMKNKFLHRGGRVSLLGLMILPNGRVTVDRGRKQKIEILLHYYATNSMLFLKLVGNDAEKGREKIAGHLRYLNSVDKNYLDKLRHRYGAATIDGFLTASAGSYW